MKTLGRLLLLLLLVGGIALFFWSRQNHTSFSPNTIDLRVTCSDLTDVAVTSAVDVVVENLSARSHRDISVRLNAYDASGKLLKEKFTTFSRTLEPHSQFDKPVTLPAGTTRCECEIASSTPVN